MALKKELQAQLDMLLSIVGGNKEHSAYKKLEAAMKEADKVKKSEWNDPNLHKKMQEASDSVVDNS